MQPFGAVAIFWPGDAAMSEFEQYQQLKFQENCRKLGYQVRTIAELGTINSVLIDMEHLPTGARHIHIGNDDRENTFSVAFKTVPTDSTGVAHILEHTVLCGSRKFPVRDPFFSMLKTKLEYVYERIHRFGLDHVSILHSE